MVFILTGKSKPEVQEKVNEIIYTIEKQGKFDYLLDVREISQGKWKATLQLFWHKDAYPSDYNKPEVVHQLPRPQP